MSRRRADTEAEQKVTNKLLSYGDFEGGLDPIIGNIATKDQGTQEIADSLCHAGTHGQKKLECFVKERLLPNARNEDMEYNKFHDTVERNYPPTFES